MQIPENIRITDVAGKPTAFLSPKADGLKDCHADTRLNGESTLEFLLPATSEKIKELTPECEIWANGRVYNLRKDDAVDTIRDDKNKLWAKVMAVERWSELDTSYVEPSISNDPTAVPPADLAVVIVGGGSNLSSGRFATGTAGHALHAILQGSNWTVGAADITTIRDLEMEKVSRLEIVKQIQNIWGGYLIWDSVNRVVHLRDAHKWQNYTGFQVRYRKNLKHITRTESNKLITKLYAFGYEDLDISSVNGGKKYVTNNNYTSRVYIGVYRNPDIHYQDELLEKAKAELELISRPRHLYKVKMVDLRTLPEYEHEQYELGDMVDVVDPDVAPDSPRPRIIRHKYNLFQPWNCELDIGDPEERLIEQLKASFGTSGFIDGIFNGNGNMSGENLTDESIRGKKIRIGSIEIGHLDEGFIPGLDLLQNPVFSSYAQQVTDIGGVVTSQGTLIQQNASTISLQATSITNLGSDLASLTITSGQIASQVSSHTGEISSIKQTASGIQSQVSSLSSDISSLSSDVSSNSSSITQLSNSISSIVSFTDVTGNQIASKINQTATSIEISASKIDLTGVTTIYSSDCNSKAVMGGGVGDFSLTYRNNEFFRIYNEMTGVSLRSYGNRILSYSTIGYETNAHGTWNFSGATVSGFTLKFA